MKREALRHPKMLDLAGRLRIPREYAIGIVQVLIDWTHDMAPQGNIGKWPDGAIAVACGWPGDPGEFISALVDARWLDRHPVHRLLVHDYPDHTERFVKAKLHKSRQWFCSAYYANGRKWDAPDGILPPGADDSKLPSPTTGLTTVLPSDRPPEPTAPRDQTKPNQSKPNQTKPVEDGGGGDLDLWGDPGCAERVGNILQSCGYSRAVSLIREAKQLGMTPGAVVGVCREYQANRSKFDSPGAIANRIRTGAWPANGIVAAGETDAVQRKREKKQRDSVAIGIIKAGRTGKKSDEQIKAELKSAGLEWPHG